MAFVAAPQVSLTSYWNERKAHETGGGPISSGYTLGFRRGREERGQAQFLQLLVHILWDLSHQRVLNPLAHPQGAQPDGLQVAQDAWHLFGLTLGAPFPAQTRA